MLISAKKIHVKNKNKSSSIVHIEEVAASGMWQKSAWRLEE